MPGVTPIFGWPFQSLPDPPDGASLGEDLALAIEATVNDITVGFRLLTIVTFTSTSAFTKASFPGMRAVLACAQGSGGAGGGAAATGAGESSVGAGGRAGGYGEAFVLAAALAASETVTVPAGGTGVSGGTGNNGAEASFGAHCAGSGGGGGAVLATGTAAAFVAGPSTVVGSTVGDRTNGGGHGQHGFRISGQIAIAGSGGDSQLGTSGRGAIANATGPSGNGRGGGGSGSYNQQSQAARAGGAGADAIVIVYVYM